MFFDQELVRVRAGTRTDRGGNVVENWAPEAVTRLTLEHISVQPASQVEVTTAERTALVTGWRAQSEPDTNPDVQARDRIEWNGLILQVVGEIARWTDPISGAVHHAEWAMSRTTG